MVPWRFLLPGQCWSGLRLPEEGSGDGVPTVVDAATIVHDSMAHLLEALEEAEQKEFLEEMISPHLHTMFVTPKDVDETVKYLSFTISEGLNMAFEEIGG